ncbi:MAG TPA: hypothetical protein ACFYEK_01865 [Candidatus Wunengus sp. YC60]|uniref:hypothetical protein n=1 Tax=Candidatus Wunengus sp. YC60 TaxID=3367697 RepID=UPI0040266E87
MIVEKNLKKNSSLELPKELLKKAHLLGKVSIIIEENEIIIKKVSKRSVSIEKIVGLGKGIFDKDSVTLQKELRKEWKR